MRLADFLEAEDPGRLRLETPRRYQFGDLLEGDVGQWELRLGYELATHDGLRVIEGSDLLVAAGRTPNTDGIGLDIAGVELDPRGYIEVNERLEYNRAGGVGHGERPQFTHVAADDFRIVRDNLAGRERTTRDRLIPYCVFIDPELARVGLSEWKAERQGIETRLARLPISAVLRARTIGETYGFMKALINPRNERILGFAMLGAEAAEVLAVVQTAMLAGLRYTGLRDAIPHTQRWPRASPSSSPAPSIRRRERNCRQTLSA